MKSLHSLMNNLKISGVLKSSLIIEVFTKIDRKDFIPKESQEFAYEDVPLSIGYNQTISQPYTIVFMLELLGPKKGDRILDVGSGSAYTTAILSETVGNGGQVFGVEIIPELVTLGKNNLAKYNFTNAKIIQAKDELGLPNESPFDKILVSASAEEIPMSLVKQLKVGGTMVIPIKNDICRIEKNKDRSIKIEKYNGFAFVPLIENKTL